MNKKYQISDVLKWIIPIVVILIILYGVWYFRFLFGCLAFAIVLSFMGKPVMRVLSKIKIGRFKLNHTLSASITLFVVVSILLSLIYFLVPLILSQVNSFSNLDIYSIADYYHEPIKKLETILHDYQIMQEDIDFETLVSNKILEVFNALNLTRFIESAISLSSNILLGFFVVIFFTFFMLKDSCILYDFVLSIVPDEYTKETEHIIENSRDLISRYFIGIFAEILIMTGLLSLGFYLVGFSNVLLAAAITSVMVILPYIGVIIGGALGLIIILTGYLSVDPSMDILPIILKFVIIFGIVKIIDDFVLQPIIYAKSVKAHPLEIFVVILMAGQMGGIIGMILAIPTYTFIRIIAKEFLSKWKIVQKITKNI